MKWIGRRGVGVVTTTTTTTTTILSDAPHPHPLQRVVLRWLQKSEEEVRCHWVRSGLGSRRVPTFASAKPRWAATVRVCLNHSQPPAIKSSTTPLQRSGTTYCEHCCRPGSSVKVGGVEVCLASNLDIGVDTFASSGFLCSRVEFSSSLHKIKTTGGFNPNAANLKPDKTLLLKSVLTSHVSNSGRVLLLSMHLKPFMPYLNNEAQIQSFQNFI